MTKWKCEICQIEVCKTNKSRHLKSPKHMRNLNNVSQQEEQQNEIFDFDDTLFETEFKNKKYKCKKCRIKVDDLDKHKKSFSHEKKVNPAMRVFDEVYGSILKCNICDEEIKYINRYRHIKSMSHQEKEGLIVNDEIKVLKTSIKKKINTIRFYNKKEFNTTIDFFQYYECKIIKYIEKYLDTLDSVKIKLVLKVQFRNMKTIIEIDHFLHSKYSAVFKSDDISVGLKSHIEQINQNINDPKIETDSGWTLNRIFHLDLYIDKYSPINGSSYIDLPKIIKNKKAVINVKNTKDNECFKWTILSALHPVDKDPQRLSKYIEFKDELSFNNINFPVQYHDYKKFELQNKDISINVFEFNENEKNETLSINPIYITKEEKATHVDILIVKDDSMNTHYCWIKDFEKLVTNQISKNGHKLYICKRCLIHFYNQQSLDEHKTYCNKNEPQRVMSPKDDCIEFKNIKCLIEIPFVIYADFESILKSISTVESDPNKSFTEQYQKHEPIGFGYQIVTEHIAYKNYLYQEYIGTNSD